MKLTLTQKLYTIARLLIPDLPEQPPSTLRFERAYVGRHQRDAGAWSWSFFVSDPEERNQHQAFFWGIGSVFGGTALTKAKWISVSVLKRGMQREYDLYVEEDEKRVLADLARGETNVVRNPFVK